MEKYDYPNVIISCIILTFGKYLNRNMIAGLIQ